MISDTTLLDGEKVLLYQRRHCCTVVMYRNKFYTCNMIRGPTEWKKEAEWNRHADAMGHRSIFWRRKWRSVLWKKSKAPFQSCGDFESPEARFASKSLIALTQN